MKLPLFNWRLPRTALLGAVLGVLAACEEPPSPFAPAAQQESGAWVGARRALSGNVTIDGITVETRRWNSSPWYVTPVCDTVTFVCTEPWAPGFPRGAAVVGTFNGLSTSVAGYTNAPVPIPNLARALVSVTVYPDDPNTPENEGWVDSVFTGIRNPGGSNKDVATRYRLAVSSQGKSTVMFQFGVDFLGGVVLVDGAVVAEKWDDPWWWLSWVWEDDAGNILTSPGVFEFTAQLSPGAHVIEVIGFENGDDGGAAARFDVGNGWQDVVGPMPTFALSVVPTGAGTGTVVSSPVGINCGAACTAFYDYGSVVTLTAVPTAPSIFAGWTGAGCSGTGTCVVSMTEARTVSPKFTGTASVQAMTIETRYWDASGVKPATPTAVSLFNSLPTNVAGYTNEPVGVTHLVHNAELFTPPNVGEPRNIATRYSISMNSVGTSEVSFTAIGDFQYGSMMLLDNVVLTANWSPVELLATATLSPGPHVIEILGFEDCCDGAGVWFKYNFGGGWISPVVTLPGPQVLTVQTGAGGGRVVSVPSGIDCGTSCAASFPYASQVTLTATPDAGYVFSGWTGACSGSGSTCVVRIQSAANVTATFTRVVLTVALTGTGTGSVASVPAGISCGADCSEDFAPNTPVTLTATADAGSSFAGWSGACTGTGACSLVMNTARNVTATFTRNTHVLTVTRTGSGTGTVTSMPAGIACGSDCTETYDELTSVTLTATPAPGSTFNGWSEACSGTGTCTTTMRAARSVSAAFAAIPGWDMTPPAISCSAAPNRLWPVNHKLVDIRVTVSLTDAGSGPAGSKLLSVTSNEPLNAKGDGNTTDDMKGWLLDAPDVTGQLRAERSGNLKDRIYTLTYRGFDVAGNTATASCTVTVPHDSG